MKKTEPGSSAVRNAATSPLRSSAGPAVCTSGALELARDDVRQRGLAEAGRAGQQHVVERLAAAARRLDEEGELVLELLLADEVLEPLRPQRAVELLLARPRGRDLDADLAGAASVTPAFTAVAQRGRDQLLGLGVVAGVGADRARASPPPRPGRSRGRPGPRARARGRPRRRRPRSGSPASSPAIRSRSSTITRSAVLRPMPGTTWKRLASPAAIAVRDLGRRSSPTAPRAPSSGPTPATEISCRNSSRSSSVAKP